MSSNFRRAASASSDSPGSDSRGSPRCRGTSGFPLHSWTNPSLEMQPLWSLPHLSYTCFSPLDRACGVTGPGLWASDSASRAARSSSQESRGSLLADRPRSTFSSLRCAAPSPSGAWSESRARPSCWATSGSRLHAWMKSFLEAQPPSSLAHWSKTSCHPRSPAASGSSLSWAKPCLEAPPLRSLSRTSCASFHVPSEFGVFTGSGPRGSSAARRDWWSSFQDSDVSLRVDRPCTTLSNFRRMASSSSDNVWFGALDSPNCWATSGFCLHVRMKPFLDAAPLRSLSHWSNASFHRAARMWACNG
mmetsp:Transcript_89523/g.253705  ORF Transcript_89523/g.253705 Transcript_89523/m.253705 type:complete len:304 (-) Transcript_89523:827-1738(-)